MVKYAGRGLVVNRPGVLSKVQMLNLVLGVGVFSFPSSNNPLTSILSAEFAELEPPPLGSLPQPEVLHGKASSLP